LVALAKIQYTRDDEPTISCINQDKNIDKEVYYVCIEFPNLLILLTMIMRMLDAASFIIIFMLHQFTTDT
jgi:hypothetical protein